MADTPASDTLSPFDPTMPPSSSLLFYLFAERVAPAARRGTQAPLAGVHVKTDRLAYALIAVAFWHLRESGRVLLEVVSERRVFRTTTHLRITRAPASTDERYDGIEGGILDILTPSLLTKRIPAWGATPKWLRDRAVWMEQSVANLADRPGFPNLLRTAEKVAPETVTDVLARWYGPSVPNPDRVPIEWTEREGVAKGLLEVVDAGRNPVAALFVGKTTLSPQRERIAALEPMFTQLHARWQAFTANESALAGQLEREVVASIDAHRETYDSGSSS